MTSSRSPARTPLATVEELMAHAYAIEAEAEDRYRELAVQMEMHNNDEVAALFRKLAAYEGQHARAVEARTKDMMLPSLAAGEFKWPWRESAELVDTLAMHYLMTPQAVLSLALDAERRAFDFFSDLASESKDREIADMAAVLAADEEEHIRMIEEMLVRFDTSAAEWDVDLDEPIAQG